MTACQTEPTIKKYLAAYNINIQKKTSVANSCDELDHIIDVMSLLAAIDVKKLSDIERANNAREYLLQELIDKIHALKTGLKNSLEPVD